MSSAVAVQTEARQTLLCLHCSASSGRQWDAMRPSLANRFDVLTPDLLGYAGGERWAAGRSASLDDEADHLEPLIDADGVHLFGHSYGGAVALQIALRWPERVKSLTLYEPVRFALLLGGENREAAAQILGVARNIAIDVMAGDLAAAAERFVDYWSGPGAWQRLGARRQQGIAERMPKVNAEFEAAFGDTMPASRYRVLTMPLHLIGGTGSPLPARRVLDLLGARLPRHTRSALTGLGHMGPVEDPAWVVSVFDAMMRGMELQVAA